MTGNTQSIPHGIYSTSAFVSFATGLGKHQRHKSNKFFFRIFFHIFPSFLYKIHFLFQFRWALQFLPGHRENIVCRRDGTLRHSEPSAGENLACIIPFILIYYFLIAANIWFSIFTYAWYLQTKDRGMASIILI